MSVAAAFEKAGIHRKGPVAGFYRGRSARSKRGSRKGFWLAGLTVGLCAVVALVWLLLVRKDR